MIKPQKLFYTAQEAANEVGVSHRQFLKIFHKLNTDPARLVDTNSTKWRFTQNHLDQVVVYRNAHRKKRC